MVAHASDVVNFEDFPDLGGFGVQKTKKQKEVEAEALWQKKRQEDNEKLPTKGKPSKFFKIESDDQGIAQLNSEQKEFMFLYYTAQSSKKDVLDHFDWLFTQALVLEELYLENTKYSRYSNKERKQKEKKNDLIMEEEEDTSFVAPNKGAKKLQQKII